MLLCHIQQLKLHGILPYGSVSAALESLVAQPNSTAVKEHEVRALHACLHAVMPCGHTCWFAQVSEDLSFLAQQLQTLKAQGHG